MTPIADPDKLEKAIKALIVACGGVPPDSLKWHAARADDKVQWLVEYTKDGIKRVAYND